ncbi:MAG: hypothetical protein LBQ89_07915 [Treponema sp.]|nr:hypothetical protein [Treponema sp.]
MKRLIAKKEEMERRNKHEYMIHAVLELRYQKRTYKQNNSVWALVTAIFESMEGRLPDEEEKYGLYLDLLEEYADKIPSRIGGHLRPVHISEADSLQGARFIDGLIYHLSKYCEFETYDYVSVSDAIERWHEWRGRLEIDPVDYADPACTQLLTEAEWREKNTLSAATGRGGDIELAHIVSRGSDAADIGKAWNWIALTHGEHAEQHRIGWDKFLHIYPHLRGRVDRARRLANKLELEFKREQNTNRGTQ